MAGTRAARDKRMWRRKYPWLCQVRMLVATAACIVHFTVIDVVLR